MPFRTFRRRAIGSTARVMERQEQLHDRMMAGQAVMDRDSIYLRTIRKLTVSARQAEDDGPKLIWSERLGAAIGQKTCRSRAQPPGAKARFIASLSKYGPSTGKAPESSKS